MSQLAVTSEIRLESLIVKAIENGWSVPRLAKEAGVGMNCAYNRLCKIRKDSKASTSLAVAKIGSDAVSVLSRLGNRDLKELSRILQKAENGASWTTSEKREVDACFRRIERLCKLFGLKFDPAQLQPSEAMHDHVLSDPNCDPETLPPPPPTGNASKPTIDSAETEGVGKESPEKIEAPAPLPPGSPPAGPHSPVPRSHRDEDEGNHEP